MGWADVMGSRSGHTQQTVKRCCTLTLTLTLTRIRSQAAQPVRDAAPSGAPATLSRSARRLCRLAEREAKTCVHIHPTTRAQTRARIPNACHPACPRVFNTSMLRAKMSEASG